VCAAPSSDPHCTVDPGTVPKAMDVITPAGVSQADELDETLHQPVVVACGLYLNDPGTWHPRPTGS
jgi:hypothetical protein